MDEERRLIQQAQQHDKQAFRKLVERHRKNVYFLALDLSGNRQDAEDISQEVFLKVYRSLENFRGDAKLSSWLYRITVNCFMDTRKRKKLATVPLQSDTYRENNHEGAAIPGTDPPEPVEKIQSSALQKHIQYALRKLSPREQMVFVLRHYQDLPLKEIGDMLEIAEGTVKTLLFRAIKRLQKELAFYQADL